MRKSVTAVVLALGRYAVLPLVAIAAVVFVAWLAALDRYPVFVLATAPVVLPLATCAIALAVGLLVLPVPKYASPAVDAQSAPGLWAIWDEFDRTSPRGSRTLLIDTELNASIGERKRFAGLFRRQLTMTFGLPLLILLDERAVRAIVAHEVAHASLQHTSGGANLFEFMAAAENIFHHADPDTTITGRLAHLLLHRLVEWLQAEYRTLSRQNELAADRDAAEWVGRGEMARALVLVEALSNRVVETIFKPLETEVLGAIRAPAPPLQRIIARLETIRAEPIDGAALAAKPAEPDENATHPPLRARLANLGFADVPSIDMAKTSAADTIMSADAVKQFLARFDGDWTRRVNEHIGIY
jgi:hypothetical protein